MRLLSYFNGMLAIIVIMVSFTNRNLYREVFSLGQIRFLDTTRIMDTALESCELNFSQTN